MFDEGCSESGENKTQISTQLLICLFSDRWFNSRWSLAFPRNKQKKDILIVMLSLTNSNAKNFRFTAHFYYLTIDNYSKYD